MTALAIARAAQGVGGALLVPGSLAIIGASFLEADRARAIGAWSGLGGVASALGPFIGGWLIAAASWRLVFLINVPIAAVTVVIALRHVPESRAATEHKIDVPGAVLASIGLGALCWALIRSAQGFGGPEAFAALVGGAALVAFFAVEARRAHPMLPLGIFRSRQFSGANGTTLAVYAALGAAMFLIVLELQIALHYSPVAAGASLLPITLLMLLLSARFGALAQRVGARVPMTVGPLLVGASMLLFTRVQPGAHYVSVVLPAALLFGLGLAVTVAPLTATVLAAVGPDELGVASGVNNAVARLAGLLAVAVLPALTRLDTTLPAGAFTSRVATAMRICAVLAAAGGVVAFATVRTQRKVVVTTQASVIQPCHDPCVAWAAD
ncbi:MAG TPA: MFS transporter [Acidimicrobiia bacterium]|nr:MFS transporter [Acidimicrobiia bacterium]